MNLHGKSFIGADLSEGNDKTFRAVSPLTNYSYVLRETLGFAYALERNLRLKVSGELWQFSYPDQLGHKNALGVHFGAVGSF